MIYNESTSEEKRVIEDKATEPAFIGEYDNFYEDGTYICRKWNAPLFDIEKQIRRWMWLAGI